MKRAEKFYIIIVLSVTVSSFGKEGREGLLVPQNKIGNFALPGSQQPGPLISFGQNIVDKGDMQLFAYIDQLKGSQQNYKQVIPAILCGVTEKLSLFIELPIAAHFTLEDFSSRGLQDMLIQFEYVAYITDAPRIVNEVTLVGRIGLPTGSAFKEPPTGFGAPSFFLGFTANRAKIDWYYFISSGVELMTSHKNTKFGNEFLYQAGLSRNIWYKADKFIFNWIIELDGTYRQRDKRLGVIDGNSGGNVLLLGPSLWFSTQRLILQLGISGVITQHLFGTQPQERYFLVADIGWKF